MTQAELKYPMIRVRLLRALADLSDVDRHSEEWFSDISEDGRGLGEVIHVLYDDTQLAVDPSGYLGLALVSEGEVTLVGDLARALGALGPLDRAARLRGDPRWDDVVAQARRALLAMVFEWAIPVKLPENERDSV